MATRNPAGGYVEVGSLSVYPIIHNVLAPSQVVGLGISEPSTVFPTGKSSDHVGNSSLIHTMTCMLNPYTVVGVICDFLRLLLML